MTQDHATPVPRRTLAIVHAGTEAGPAPVPPVLGPSTEPGTAVPAPAGTVAPMSAAERAGTAVRYRAAKVAAVARELWFHPDRLAHAMWNGKPESLAGYWAYICSRAWVPPELTGWKAAVIAWAGFAYHALIGWPLACAGKLLGAAAVRPMRMLCLTALLAVLIFLILPRL